MIERIHQTGKLAPMPDQSANPGKFGVRLSGREIEILRLIAQGNRTKEVANMLFVSKRTIDYHLRNVFTKTSITSRGELGRLDLG